jgi:hypothetical protein
VVDTYRTGRLKFVRSLDCDLELQVAHVIAFTNAKIAAKELLLELRNLRSNVAVLIGPFVDGRVLKVMCQLVLTARALHVVVDGDGIDPPSFSSALRQSSGLSLAEPSDGWSGVGCVVSLAVVGIFKGSRSSTAVGACVPFGHGCEVAGRCMVGREDCCRFGVVRQVDDEVDAVVEKRVEEEDEDGSL